MQPSHRTISLPPQSIIGYVNGRPVRVIAGGDGTADAGTATADAGTSAGAAGQSTGQSTAATGSQANGSGQQNGQQAGQSDAQTFTWDGKVESLPADVQKIITDARADAGKARTTAKEQAAQEARDELLKQLGLKPDGTEKVDPDKLAKQLADKDAVLLALQRETAAAKSARTAGADVDALLDRRSFVDDLNKLDPTANDFTAKLDALVKAAIEKDPKLKQAQAAGVSGGQFAGGTGEGTTRPTSLGAAIKAATGS